MNFMHKDLIRKKKKKRVLAKARVPVPVSHWEMKTVYYNPVIVNTVYFNITLHSISHRLCLLMEFIGT